MLPIMKKTVLPVLASALAFSVSAQLALPDTLWIPVTFYDFHADGSNPEFNPDHNGGLHTGMVQETLSPARKPVLGSRPFFNQYIAKWFVQWAPGDFTVPTYTDKDGTYSAGCRRQQLLRHGRHIRRGW